jgi:hypothetical protein
MKFTIFPVGSRVRVASYSPFRGLTGTVQKVHAIAGWDEPFCFYLIALEGTSIVQPVWFLYEEVECVSLQEMDYLGEPLWGDNHLPGECLSGKKPKHTKG